MADKCYRCGVEVRPDNYIMDGPEIEHADIAVCVRLLRAQLAESQREVAALRKTQVVRPGLVERMRNAAAELYPGESGAANVDPIACLLEGADELEAYRKKFGPLKEPGA